MRIVSDGSVGGTKFYDKDGVEIKGMRCRSFTINQSVGNGNMPTATLEVLPDSIDVTVMDDRVFRTEIKIP